MANQKVTGIKRIVNAFGYSILGFKASFQHEAAFRQELLLRIHGLRARWRGLGICVIFLISLSLIIHH